MMMKVATTAKRMTKNDNHDMTPRKPLKSRLAAYGDMSEEDLEDDVEELQVEDWQKSIDKGKAPTGRSPQSPPLPPSKSQIMSSVEEGHGSTLEKVQGYDEDYETEGEEWDTQALEEWKNPRNARGGTEESEGGDYQPY